jgi:hypothetical protein
MISDLRHLQLRSKSKNLGRVDCETAASLLVLNGFHCDWAADSVSLPYFLSEIDTASFPARGFAVAWAFDFSCLGLFLAVFAFDHRWSF